MIRNLREIAAVTLIGLAIAALVYRSFKFGGYFPDDAYITFRFAQHLSEGHGIVWNIGGPPTEGSTSFLLTLILAGANAIGMPAAQASYYLSAIALFGLVALSIGSARQIGHRIGVAWASAMALFFSGAIFNIHLASGMETALSMTLLLASFFISLKLFNSPTLKNAALLAGINFLALWCRPDSVVYIGAQGVVLTLLALMPFHDVRTRLRRPLVFYFSLLVAAGLAFLAWKKSYFGYVLPNSYYVKSGSLTSLDGLADVLVFLKDTSIRMLFAFPFLVAIDWQKIAVSADRDAVARAALLAAPVAAFLGMNISVLHVVNYGYRFEYPVAIFFWLGLGWLLASGRADYRLEMLYSRFLPNQLAVAFVAIVAVVCLGLSLLRDRQHHWHWHAHIQLLHYEPFSAALVRAGAGAETTLLYDAAGYIPYSSKVSFLDPVGLTENAISGRTPISAQEREAYLWNSMPDIYLGPFPPATPGSDLPQNEPILKTRYGLEILLNVDTFADYGNSLGNISATERLHLAHLRMRELRDNYISLGEFPYPGGEDTGYTHFVFVRRGAPLELPLVDALSQITTRSIDEIDFENIALGYVPYAHSMAAERSKSK